MNYYFRISLSSAVEQHPEDHLKLTAPSSFSLYSQTWASLDWFCPGLNPTSLVQRILAWLFIPLYV